MGSERGRCRPRCGLWPFIPNPAVRSAHSPVRRLPPRHSNRWADRPVGDNRFPPSSCGYRCRRPGWGGLQTALGPVAANSRRGHWLGVGQASPGKTRVAGSDRPQRGPRLERLPHQEGQARFRGTKSGIGWRPVTTLARPFARPGRGRCRDCRFPVPCSAEKWSARKAGCPGTSPDRQDRGD